MIGYSVSYVVSYVVSHIASMSRCMSIPKKSIMRIVTSREKRIAIGNTKRELKTTGQERSIRDELDDGAVHTSKRRRAVREEDVIGESHEVQGGLRQAILTTGKRISIPQCIHLVLECLKRKGSSEYVNAMFLVENALLDVRDDANVGIKRALMRCESVDVREDHRGFYIRKKEPLGVRDADTLRDLFQRRLPSKSIIVKSGASAVTVTENQLADCYPSVEKDLDSLIEGGECRSLRLHHRELHVFCFFLFDLVCSCTAQERW